MNGRYTWMPGSSTRCAMAGADCPNPATETVTLTGVGVRGLCADHLATLERMGLHFRRLGERIPNLSRATRAAS